MTMTEGTTAVVNVSEPEVLTVGNHSYIFLDRPGRPNKRDNVRFILDLLKDFELNHEHLTVTGWRLEVKGQDGMASSPAMICGLWVDHEKAPKYL